MDILPIMSSLEMLCINLASFDHCCQRKYSRIITYLVLAVFTMLLFFCMYFLFPNYGDGSLLIIGFLYLLPFSILYRGKWPRLFFVMCMCWAYTMSVFVLAYQSSRLFAEEALYLNTFLFQTALYAISSYPFFKWITPKYLTILQNLEKFDNGSVKYFHFTCLLHFIIVFILNLAFHQGEGSVLKVLSILLLTAITFLSYTMLYRMVSDSIRIGHLEQTSQHDALTGLANRTRLFADLQTLLEDKQIFSILFLDLDRFKEVNDHYGHVIGDQYLQHFATICLKVFPEKGQVYRFGGDEFVVLYPGIIPQKAIEQIQQCQGWEKGAPCPFNQVSTGFIVCRPPFSDAEQLMHQVDQEMYKMKIQSKRGLPT